MIPNKDVNLVLAASHNYQAVLWSFGSKFITKIYI